ncbi:GSCFA domain-containing protein [Sphingomonas sp. Root710]|uniref:GSCFA domain-containing protein n=1 Tax=Sphingomonas sp. Root710 TaxID=1736594 RepID=UPI0009EADEC0|nr:GSCFA domain-containing protein [Sphingomonas sp. Root710]
MANPYSDSPDYAFWERAITNVAEAHLDLVTNPPFAIGPGDAVATAGSCFAQHIARTLSAQGFNYLVTETEPSTPGAVDEGYGLFSARFGNIYTVRQLLQLFDRAYGLFKPADRWWHGRKGGFVDPFRPRIQEGGFASIDDLEADRTAHLLAVQRLFEDCRIFIFTLGLTEGWISTRDGAVFPLAPGVGGVPENPEYYAPHNFRAASMIADMEEFLTKLRSVNPAVQVILTVSPVPLIATFEDRHVALSTSYSKSALRVVAEEASQDKDWVAYFPSYELVTGHYSSGFFEEDLRNVRPEGVSRVMQMFRTHYLSGESRPVNAAPRENIKLSEEDRQRFRAVEGIVCDEEAIISEMDKR